jgi:hypothetical protein
MLPDTQLTPVCENLPDSVYRLICEGKARNDGIPPSLMSLALQTRCSAPAVETALQELVSAGKIAYFPRSPSPVIIVTGARWIGPQEAGTADPRPASALKVNGADYALPSDVANLRRDVKHFRAAALMHMAEIERLESQLARFGSESQSIRKLKLENRTLRAENQRLTSQARASAAAWLGIARRNQRDGARALLPN